MMPADMIYLVLIEVVWKYSANQHRVRTYISKGRSDNTPLNKVAAHSFKYLRLRVQTCILIRYRIKGCDVRKNEGNRLPIPKILLVSSGKEMTAFCHLLVSDENLRHHGVL